MKIFKNINILKNSVLKNFIISYLLVFLLPLIIIFAVFYHTGMDIVKKEIYNSKITTISQFRYTIDNEIKRMKATVSYLNNNIELNNLLRLKEEEFEPMDRYDMMKITRDLAVYRMTDPFIDNIYIYLSVSDRCITADNSKEAIYAFDDLYKKSIDNISFKEWQSTMYQNHLGDLKSISVNSSKDINSKLYYMQSLPIIPPKSNYATVVFEFNNELIKDAMDIDGLNINNTLGVLGKDNEILLSNNNVNALNIKYDMFKESKGTVALNKSIIYYVKSTVSPEVFFLIVPEENYIKEFRYIQTIAFLVFTICIILGAGLTYFFSVRNYNPLRKLLTIMKQVSNTNDNEDEYTQIKLALLDALDEKSKYEHQIKENIDMQNNKKIYKLLTKGELKEDELKEKLIAKDIVFKNKYFCCIKVILSDYSTNFVDDNITQVLFICKNVYEEMFKLSYDILTFIQEKSFLMLINLNEECNNINKIKDITLEAQKFMRDNYVVDSYAAISDIHENLEAIKTVFYEVEESIKYFELIGKGTIVAYSDFSKLTYTERLIEFMIKEEKALIGNIKAYDFQNAKDTLNLIFKKYFFDDVKSPQLIRCRLFSLVNNIIDALATLDIPEKDKFIENMHPYSKILNCNNAYEFQLQLNFLLDEISKEFAMNDSNKDNDLKEIIIKIVQESYSNPDLNVSFIAEKVGKNLDYISRFFKKTAMIGLLDYIHDIRIEEAKKLLQNTNYTIDEISAMVGYTSCYSFIRVFRKKEGMPPGKYRNNAI